MFNLSRMLPNSSRYLRIQPILANTKTAPSRTYAESSYVLTEESLAEEEKKPIESSDQRPTRRGRKRVFVGNLPLDAGEMEMIRLFAEVGPVVEFSMPKYRRIGFCKYQHATSAAKAVETMNGFEYKGKKLVVEYEDTTKRVKQPSVMAHQ